MGTTDSVEQCLFDIAERLSGMHSGGIGWFLAKMG